jgi:hypothetical protein
MRPKHLQDLLDSVLPPRPVFATMNLSDIENVLRHTVRDQIRTERAVGAMYGAVFKKREAHYDATFAHARYGKPLNPHNHIVAIDPPGTTNRRWECQYCQEMGSCDDLTGQTQKNACTYVYPACPHCGQTPECAADCAGIAAALGSPNVRVIP